jgi:putative Ca2+/H+ antiporter (TMEM165/GDT1 family)
MIQELFKAFILIFIAEMGDKTQILAMAFATRFPVKKVLLGIFLGSLLNHGLAVVFGSYISNFIPINTIQIVAGFAFVMFSLWTLKSDSDEDEDEKQKSKFGPVVTVALAFFIGELGDKTQLTAITLATDAAYPAVILAGTVLGMLFTGGIGIIVGKKVGGKIPEFTIKIIAASVFMFFGISKLYQTIPSEYLNLQNISVFAAIIAIVAFILLRPAIIKRRHGQESVLKRKSRELYDYYNQVEENIDKVCLGVGGCGACQGDNCIVGHTKTLIKQGLDESEPIQRDFFAPKEETIDKDYDKAQVLKSLRLTLELINKDPNNIEYENIHAIRRNLEIILFGRSIEKINNWAEYAKSLTDIDETVAISVLKDINA